MCQNGSFSSLLDSPQFLTVTMYSITLLSLPIHFFAAYCILFKTPPQMKSMKWAMLNVHLWSVSLDLSFSFLIIPFMYQPVLAGYSLGFLSRWGIRLQDQFYLCVVQIGCVMVSITLLFETRFFILYASDTPWRHFRRPWLLLNYSIALLGMIPTYLSIPDQPSGKAYQLGRYPCLPAEVYEDRVFLLSTWSTGVALNSLLNTTTQQTILFISLIYCNMKKSMSQVKMSKKTIDLHRKFMRSLVLQVAIPVATVILPLSYNTLATLYSYYNQGANNISVSIMATHGLVSSLAMVYLHKSYWEVLTLCPRMFFVEDTAVFTKSVVIVHY